MGFFSKFTKKNSSNESVNAEIAHASIVKAKQGQISVDEMLNTLARSQIFVPLSGPPVMNGSSISSWHPATIRKPDNSCAYVVAFTNQEIAEKFTSSNQQYNHAIQVNTNWVLSVLPNEHGIVFNIGSNEGFEWSPQGIASYLKTN